MSNKLFTFPELLNSPTSLFSLSFFTSGSEGSSSGLFCFHPTCALHHIFLSLLSFASSVIPFPADCSACPLQQTLPFSLQIYPFQVLCSLKHSTHIPPRGFSKWPSFFLCPVLCSVLLRPSSLAHSVVTLLSEPDHLYL